LSLSRARTWRRWPVNAALGAANLLLVRLASVAGPVTLASLAAKHHFGVFNQLPLPNLTTVILIIVLMDGAVYWQHRAFHRFKWAWALHKLHHADVDFDVTTGVRFHPGEALISMLFKGGVAALLGAPPAVVILFETWLAIGSLIEHGNIALPASLDRVVRRLWVTPAMHRIHHHAEGNDHQHNFSFALSVWDHLFGTYRASSLGRKIGLPTRLGRNEAE
jgi:sterol desaturase/sphingolipid hydroxylase (fatty acid hydroxylase superfamily)